MWLIKMIKYIWSCSFLIIFCIGKWVIKSYSFDYNDLIIEDIIVILRLWMFWMLMFKVCYE